MSEFMRPPQRASVRTSKEPGRLAGRLVFALALALAFDLPRRKAERRFCAVGNPAWMPG